MAHQAFVPLVTSSDAAVQQMHIKVARQVRAQDRMTWCGSISLSLSR